MRRPTWIMAIVAACCTTTVAAELPEGLYRTELSSNLLEEIRRVLIPGQPLQDRHPEFLAQTINPNLILPEAATIEVTFVDELAGYRNAFGYFVYDEDNVMIEAGPIFSNCSELGGGGELVPGDTLQIGPFPAGAQVGFFVIADGYTAGAETPDAPMGQPVYTTVDALNANNDRHVAMIACASPVDTDDPPFLLAFEDLPLGTGDGDYNDLITIVRITPESVVDRVRDLGRIPGTDAPVDSDDDGVNDAEDDFPDDPRYAYRRRVPAPGRNFFLAFEDNFPRVGDGDYNDFVLGFFGEQFVDANNRVRKIRLVHLAVARGASFRHAFRHRIRMASSIAVTSEIRRYDRSWQLREVEESTHRDVIDLLIFPSTHEAVFDDVSGSILPNTEPNAPQVPGAYTETILSFDIPVPVGAFEPLPADPYLLLNDTGYDIHLPTQPALPGSVNPTTANPGFLDDRGYPFALLVPSNWQYPEAGVFIERAYPQFEAWRVSNGNESPNWFDFPADNGTRDYGLVLPD